MRKRRARPGCSEPRPFCVALQRLSPAASARAGGRAERSRAIRVDGRLRFLRRVSGGAGGFPVEQQFLRRAGRAGDTAAALTACRLAARGFAGRGALAGIGALAAGRALASHGALAAALSATTPAVEVLMELLLPLPAIVFIIAIEGLHLLVAPAAIMVVGGGAKGPRSAPQIVVPAEAALITTAAIIALVAAIAMLA